MKGYKNPITNKYKLIKHEQSNTNVITYIANDIKLEVNNNIPVLKAGSVVYVPNGFEQDGTTKKFDKVVLEADCTSSSAWSATHYLFFRTSNPTVFQRSSITKTHSGDTTPTPVGNDDMWYDTANNIIKRYDGTNWNAQGTCLPVGIYNGTTQQFEAIFNGFGFIDLIEFVLPDVRVLIPNGLNADGTFKIVEYTNASIRTSTGYPNTHGQIYFLMADGGRHTVRTDRYMWGSDSAKPTTVATTNAFMYYAIDTNIMYTTYGSTTADWTPDLSVPLYTTYGDGTTITSITPRAVEPSIIPIYKAVDLN